MDIGAPTVSTGDLNNFIDDAINREANQRDTHQDSKSSHNISEIPTVPSTNCPITPTNDEPNHIPAAPPPAPKKSLKWNNLPKRDTSNRTQKPPERYALLSTDNTIAINDSLNLGFVAVANEPQSFQEALQSPYSKQWEEAIQSEFRQLQTAGVFEWVNTIPKGKKVVGSQIVFKEKLDGHSQRIKFKARIVAKGFSQVPREDFTETFSSVAKFTTLHVFLALSAHLDFEIHQVDVVAAYLQGDLDKEIYMEVPKGVEHLGSGGHYWHLRKALYGLKQAGRQWKKKLYDVLSNLSLVRSFANNCLYIKKEKGKIVLLVLVYVDNMAVSGPNGHYIISFKELLGNDFEITDLGKLKFMLGILITQD